MTLSAITSIASQALPTVNFHPHGHRKGAANDASSTSSTSGSLGGIGIGQLPVGASTPLFNSILQSLQQTVGAQATTASGTVTAASGTVAAATASSGANAASAAGTAANVQAFMHSLFQALKQDGPGTVSLQHLIQQVSAGGTGAAATADLSTAYQNLVNGVAGSTAASTATTAGSSTAGLQQFLGNLLGNLQRGGVGSVSSIGNNVNANV